MDLQRMIAELKAEKTRLDEAILALERLSAGKLRRRGRPPRWVAEELKHKAAAAGEGSEENTN
ncbi:MAG TPA: hypothetical protein VH369_01525 [Bryobacteraceae bacterium]|jgi:hypothetical protein